MLKDENLDYNLGVNLAALKILDCGEKPNQKNVYGICIINERMESL